MDILRTSCVIGAIIFALPVPQGDRLAAVFDGPSNWHFMSMISDKFSDVDSLCTAQPKVCASAEYIVDAVQAKAQYSGQLLVDWVTEATNQGGDMITSIQAYADTIQTGSTSMIEDISLRGPLYPDKG